MDEHVSAPKLKSIGVIALATYCVRPQPGLVVRSREKIMGIYKKCRSPPYGGSLAPNK